MEPISVSRRTKGSQVQLWAAKSATLVQPGMGSMHLLGTNAEN